MLNNHLVEQSKKIEAVKKTADYKVKFGYV